MENYHRFLVENGIISPDPEHPRWRNYTAQYPPMTDEEKAEKTKRLESNWAKYVEAHQPPMGLCSDDSTSVFFNDGNPGIALTTELDKSISLEVDEATTMLIQNKGLRVRITQKLDSTIKLEIESCT